MCDRRAGVAIDLKPDKSDAMSELRRAAFHEAGHAVIGTALGFRLIHVSLSPPRARFAVAPLNRRRPGKVCNQMSGRTGRGRIILRRLRRGRQR